jgi:hypothetical protein
VIEQFDSVLEAGWLHDDAPVDAQVAAALAAFTLNELQPAGSVRADGGSAGNGREED